MDNHSMTPWHRAFPRGLVQELAAARHAARRSPERFVVFAQGRSGSTLLTTSLDAHPQIRCEGELLELPRVAPVAFVENCAKATAARWFGFHAKIYQLYKRQRAEDLGAFMRGLHARGWRILHLWRENLFEQAVSTMFAKRTGRYHFSDDEARPAAVTLSPQALVAKMEARERVLDRERAALAGVPHHALCYERDLRDPSARAEALGGVLDYLGAPPAALASPLRKAIRRPLAETIVNHDEVVEAVSATRFARFLVPASRNGKAPA